MLLGILILKKSYVLREYLSILCITVGIAMCTFASVHEIKTKHDKEIGSSKDPASTETRLAKLLWTGVGIGMLTLCLLLSALMGIIQERMFVKYGKHPAEALYYNHVLTMPAFLPMYANIAAYLHLFSQSQPLDLVLFSVPILWVYLIANVLTQYVCISSVFVLSTECPSLTVTLVLTLRKFASLIMSILYFNNPFTFWHWCGSALVFGGTLTFTNFFRLLADRMAKTSASELMVCT